MQRNAQLESALAGELMWDFQTHFRSVFQRLWYRSGTSVLLSVTQLCNVVATGAFQKHDRAPFTWAALLHDRSPALQLLMVNCVQSKYIH